ncbi:GAF domain-containing protein [Sphingomonas sp. HF-S3]|uniref:GAF domain-containing protein n=1 Tax=Sphingomonas rustica TaxID=3103142 RepID=A0ABV0B949_9SPHN
MEVASLERRRRLMDMLGQLAQVDSIDGLVMALRGSARAIGNADGITVVRRIGNRVAYVAEDAASPLWAGHDFPIETCISGIAMTENRPIVIDDIYADNRVPIDAYRSTFVKSMAMFPIGMGEPRMAMGGYWARVGPIDQEAIALLSNLARAASPVFDRVDRHQLGAAG